MTVSEMKKHLDKISEELERTYNFEIHLERRPAFFNKRKVRKMQQNEKAVAELPRKPPGQEIF